MQLSVMFPSSDTVAFIKRIVPQGLLIFICVAGCQRTGPRHTDSASADYKAGGCVETVPVEQERPTPAGDTKGTGELTSDPETGPVPEVEPKPKRNPIRCP